MSGTAADLQRDSDCPADWCKCECHSLSPGEEEEPRHEEAAEEEEFVSVRLENKRLGESATLVDPSRTT